jgi:Uncharacterized protein conserved in bacteria (DUF2188)
LSPRKEGDDLVTRNRYIVVHHDGEWKIEHEGQLSARYRTQEEALLDALNAARRLDKEGQGAEVLTQGADLGLRTEWSNRLERLRASVGQGVETQLKSALAHQLNATVEKSSGAEGTCVTITAAEHR